MKNLILFLLIVGGLYLGYSFANKKNDVSNNTNVVEEEIVETENGTTTVMVPLITENEAESNFGPFGCLSYVNFVPQEVPETQAVLNSVYGVLFSGQGTIDGYQNIVASQTNLGFDSVVIENGTAKVYLTGFVMGNHCADATFAAQIEQAALQYPTVSNIEVYVEGELFDWCSISDADPEESGCDTTPRLWNSQRIFEN